MNTKRKVSSNNITTRISYSTLLQSTSIHGKYNDANSNDKVILKKNCCNYKIKM